MAKFTVKTLPLILFLLFLLIHCEKSKIEYYENENGIMYAKSNGIKQSQKLYNGKIVKFYQNGKKKSEYSYKDGKKNGLFIHWYENGEKKQEGFNKNGEWDGLIISWWENGQKSSEVLYKNDIIINIVGRWNEDGSRIWTIDSSKN